MRGTLSGVVLDVRSGAGVTELRLAGETPNGHSRVCWIHTVKFTGTRAQGPFPARGSVVRAEVMATYVQFTGRQGNKASRVEILGVKVERHNGLVVQRGGVPFLMEAENRFLFSGYAVKPAVHKPQFGVTSLRMAVPDRRGALHYFECEGWRERATSLAQFARGAELAMSCILRRDHKEIGGVKCAFDVMEVQAVSRTSLQGRPRPLSQAAD